MPEFLPTKKLTEMEVQREYPISGMKFVQTRYGKRVVVELSGQFAVFLPERLAKAFENDEALFQQMIESSQKNHLYMTYHGGKYNSVTFKDL